MHLEQYTTFVCFAAKLEGDSQIAPLTNFLVSGLYCAAHLKGHNKSLGQLSMQVLPDSKKLLSDNLSHLFY